MASSPSDRNRVKNIRTKPLDSSVQFMCWSYPKHKSGNEPLQPDLLAQHPNISVIATAQLGNINSSAGPSYFNGYDTYSITGAQNWWSKESATNVGKRWADWFELQGLIFDPSDKNKQMGENGTRFAGGIFAQDWGGEVKSSTVQNHLMSHPDDLLWYTDPNTQAKIGLPAGWHKNSCKPLRTLTDLEKCADTETLSLGDFILWAANTLKKECDARKLCYPKYLAWDFEGNAGIYYAADSTHNVGCLIGHEGVNSPSTGIKIDNAFDLILQDPRFKTEIVYEEWDGKKWAGKTLFDAYTEAGYDEKTNKGYTAGNKDKWIYWFQDINREFMRKMEPYYHRINDHALNQVLYTPMRQIFPNIVCGNYNIRHELNSAVVNQHFETRNLWARIPFKDFANKKYLRADYQCPVCYSVDMSKGKYTADTYQDASVIESSPPNGLYYWNAHSLGKTSQEIYKNCMVQYVRSCTATSKTNPRGNPIPTIPWIEPPNEKVGGSEGLTVHDASQDDILYILQEQYKLGVRTWLVFNALANYDIWIGGSPNCGDATSVRVQKFIEVVDKFVAWTKTQTVQYATIVPPTVTTKTSVKK